MPFNRTCMILTKIGMFQEPLVQFVANGGRVRLAELKLNAFNGCTLDRLARLFRRSDDAQPFGDARALLALGSGGKDLQKIAAIRRQAAPIIISHAVTLARLPNARAR